MCIVQKIMYCIIYKKRRDLCVLNSEQESLGSILRQANMQALMRRIGCVISVTSEKLKMKYTLFFIALSMIISGRVCLVR